MNWIFYLKISAVALLILLCLIALGFLTYLAIRRKKINFYEAEINTWNKEIFKIENEENANLAIIKNLVKLNSDYLKHKDELIQINQETNKKIQQINEIKIQLNEEIDKKKLSKSTKEYKKMRKEINELNLIHNRFYVALPFDLTNLYEQMQIALDHSFKCLNTLKEYLNSHKQKLAKAFDSLEAELKELFRTTQSLEEENKKDNLNNLLNEIYENQKKIDLFIKKINGIKNLEWFIFNYLPHLNEEILNLSNNHSQYNDYQKEIVILQETWLNNQFPKNVKKVQKLAFTLTKIKYRYEVRLEEIKFIENNLNELKNQILIVVNTLKDFNDAIREKDREIIYEMLTEIKNDFNLIKNDLENEELIFHFKNLALKILDLQSKVNEQIINYQKAHNHKNYKDFLINNLENLYNYIFSNLTIYLDNNKQNMNKMKELLKYNKAFNDEWIKRKKMSLSSKNFIKRNELIQEIYIEATTKKIYQKMVEIWITQLEKLKIQNKKIVNLLLSINQSKSQNDYEQIFNDLKKYTKRESKNVFKNFNEIRRTNS
ncbi:hypothetical protein [Mycoplasmopsis gallinarum]|uniref:Septation ring formation regulator EzrA n=1 Tax=Mycoplasmopsis gallinarum TaxID=29557 RepID=A0A168RE06_9BACT|nr:hypothetical protein [Mycoplasmopsis gallinarum]OAB48886.1 hypothetical protein MGALLINA_03680 [Mycoplasmopsis gallinarum]